MNVESEGGIISYTVNVGVNEKKSDIVKPFTSALVSDSHQVVDEAKDMENFPLDKRGVFSSATTILNKTYTVLQKYTIKDLNVKLDVGNRVEVLDTDREDQWLVRSLDNKDKVS